MSWANTPKPKFNGRKKVSSMRFLFSFSENNCIFNSIDELSKQTRINVEWEETVWRIRLLSDLFGCLEKNWSKQKRTRVEWYEVVWRISLWSVLFSCPGSDSLFNKPEQRMNGNFVLNGKKLPRISLAYLLLVCSN